MLSSGSKDIFKQLTAGISFDKKKFRVEAEKFGLCTKDGTNKNGPEKKPWISLDETPVPDSNLPSSESEEEDNEEEDESSLTLLGDMTVQSKKAKKDKRPKSREAQLRLHKENVNRFRNVNRIHVNGTDIADPIDDWTKLKDNHGMPDNLLSVVQSAYATPTPIQMQAIPLMLERRELLACAPTGSGKTAAYVLPVVHHLREPRNKKGFRAVIVAPTRELSLQIHRECARLCEPRQLRAYVIDKVQKFQKSSRKGDILVTTPNRLVYLLQQDIVSLRNVEWLIVDESDKLFEAGPKGFRDQLAAIYQACDGANVRRAMFSATLAVDVEQWCKLNLDNVASVTIGERNATTETVEQRLLYTGTERGKMIAFKSLLREGLKPPVLVFVQEKDRAKELFAELVKEGIHVDVIHSERSVLQRDNTVKAFRAGTIWVLICTELMGRGIDFKGVNLVINYDFPPSTISYVHRIGRTGRAGRPGKAVTFFTDKDKTLLRNIASIVKASGGEVPEYMLHLKKANRKEKRKLAKTPVERENISRESEYDKEKREKMDKIIAKSKANKRKREERWAAKQSDLNETAKRPKVATSEIKQKKKMKKAKKSSE